MRLKKTMGWLVLPLLTLLLLSACVRPIPREEPAAAPTVAIESAPTLPAALPEQPLPTAASGDVLPVETVPGEVPTQAPPTVAATAEPTIHTVQAGDTLFLIALQYDSTVEEIAAVNNIEDINRLEIGQQLIIPAPGTVVLTSTPEAVAPAETPAGEVPAATGAAPTTTPAVGGGTHVVQAGENLFRISLQYGCTVEEMAAYNGITNPTLLDVGQVLQVPDCN